MRGDITRQRIKALHPPEGKERWLWDSKISGFGVKVTPAGVKSFYLQYRLGGRGCPTKRLWLGRTDWTPLEVAREEAERARRLVFQGKDPQDVRRRAAADAQQGARLFTEEAEAWLEGHSRTKRSAKTYAEDQRLYERIVRPAFAGRSLADISTEDVERIHNQLAKTPNQANRVMGFIGMVCRYAIKHKRLSSNPCAGVPRFKEIERTRFLQADEIRRLLSTLAQGEKDGKLSLAFCQLIRLLLFTGCRKDEIRQLQWDRVDLRHATLTLVKAKTGPRTVHLNQLAMEVLRTIKRHPGNPYVIVSPTKAGRYLGDTAHHWKRLCGLAGLKDFRIHDLRHCFASLGVALGMDLYRVGKLLGHTRQATTARYAHLSEGILKEATASIGTALTALINNPPAPGDVVPLPKKRRAR